MADLEYTGTKGRYTVAKELGRGGEGTVYQLANDPTLVLKVYIEPLSADKIRKLRAMAAITNTQLQTYTAWPQDVVTDKSGVVCGFVMKKLVNFIPLHMLFSPMDRKKIFPDKGYNFLVHVARNLAAAFNAVHSAGLIIGDVNEGNILVNSQGMVAFIDCDSFQVKDGDSWHFCEVGVPRFTAPELMEQSSFQNIVRTTNTDSFSMAILIFQLLFLGRHPFSGINYSNQDISEDVAIRNHWFAYSLKNQQNKLRPPVDSYDIHNLSDGLSELFHQAFEQNIGRPLPLNWIKALDGYQQQLITCKKEKIHSYPGKLKTCVWCYFKEQRNILYFLDDSFLKHIQSLDDFDKFINGFKVERLNFKWADFPTAPKKLVYPTPIDKKFKGARGNRIKTGVLLALLSVLLVLLNPIVGIVAGIISGVAVFSQLIFKNVSIEYNYRKKEVDLLKQQLDAVIGAINKPQDLSAYNSSTGRLDKLIYKFKNLNTETASRRRAWEEKLYSQQLHIFLAQFDIEAADDIVSFGPSRKASLKAAGIKTAADINKLNTQKVTGVGPKNVQVLFSWQRQLISKFIYHPDHDLLQTKNAEIAAEVKQMRNALEVDIKKEHQNFQYLKTTVSQRQEQLQKQFEVLTERYFQAQAEFNEFQRVIN